MMKRTSREPENHKPTQEAVGDDEANMNTKRFCHSTDISSQSTDERKLTVEDITVESPVADASASGFSIRGEDLNLLGDSFANIDINEILRIAEQMGNYQDSLIHSEELEDVDDTARSVESVDEGCGDDVQEFVDITDDRQGQGSHPTQLDNETAEHAGGETQIETPENVSSLIEELDYPSNYHRPDPNYVVYNDGDPGQTRVEAVGGNDGNQVAVPDITENESESDCEIIGVVPNQRGEVMNNRIVPLVPGQHMAELYHRLRGLANVTSEIANYASLPQVASNDGTLGPIPNGQTLFDFLDNIAASHPQAAAESNFNLFDEDDNHHSGIGRNSAPSHENVGVATGPAASRSNEAASNANEEDDDDVIVGPMFWGPPRPPPPPPLRPPEKAPPVVSSYTFIDGEQDAPHVNEVLEDVEFLFRCPICYSTIARFKSGKVPNNNDRVIYSTKCGHMYCFECIEGVRKRRECSICRKPLRDSKQYHVIYP